MNEKANLTVRWMDPSSLWTSKVFWQFLELIFGKNVRLFILEYDFIMSLCPCCVLAVKRVSDS